MSVDDREVKLSILERLRLTGYGFRLAHKMTPSYLPCVTLRSLIIGIQPMLVLFFSARILNELDGGRDIHTLTLLAALTVGIMFMLSIARSVLTREIETRAEWERVFARMQLMQAERFTKIDYAHAEDSKISEVLARMDTQARGNGLGLMNVFFLFIGLSESFFSLIFAFLMMSVFSVGGGFQGAGDILIIFLVTGTIITLRYSAREKKVLENIYKENSKANTAYTYYRKYVSAGEAAKDVRLYNQSALLMDILKASFNFKSWISFFFFNGRQQGFVLGLNALISSGFYVFIGYNALDGSAPVGGIVQSVGAIAAFSSAFGVFIYMLGRIWANAPFMKPMREFMTLPDILAKGDKAVSQTAGHEHMIEFRSVSFRYPGTDVYALRNLSIQFNPGERVAVVGLNGSGKTTMIKLLCRLYDPTEGEILLDGVNIKQYDCAQYTALFSVVFQDYALFPIWLGQNVAASVDFDPSQVRDCLEKSGFTERLDEMPDALDTILYKSFDEDGTQISGGEAQKIALARALYKNAPIVVLDEPTAALDPIAEYEVYTTFEHTIGSKTAVFISHRLSSCRFCARIAVFDSGELVQLGTHEELLADVQGRYHELWEAQASHYRPA